MNGKSQSGFSIVEGVVAVLVVAILGLIGWRLYITYYGKQNPTTKSNSQVTTPAANSKASTTNNPYSGWKTYCSTLGGLCLQYPSDWQEKEVGSPATGDDSVNIVSSSGAIEVNYIPKRIGIGGACPQSNCFFKAESIDHTYTPNSVGLKVYKGIYSNSTAIVPQYFIGSDNQAAIYKLQLNQSVEVGFFGLQVTSPLDGSTFESIRVTNTSGDKSYPTFPDADAWFKVPEVITAGQILSSVYVNQTARSSYLDIKELGIKLPLSDDIKDLTYTYNNLYGINYIHFTTNSIMAADPTCNSDFDPLGLYTVYSDQTNANATNNMAGTLEAHVNGYYIYYRHAQVTCSKSTAGSIATSSIPSVLKAVQGAQAQ